MLWKFASLLHSRFKSVQAPMRFDLKVSIDGTVACCRSDKVCVRGRKTGCSVPVAGFGTFFTPERGSGLQGEGGEDWAGGHDR